MNETDGSATPDQIGEVLAAGGLVVLPTDTVYGLAARAADPVATGRLFACKGREASVPIAVLCADAEQAFALVDEVPAVARSLAEAHWPGAMTLVLPRRADLDWELGEPRSTIGLRCPDDACIRAVAGRVGPLATTSANRHGVPTPATAAEAAASLLEPVDLVVDGGPRAGVASTVVDLCGPDPVVLRQGAVRIDDVFSIRPDATSPGDLNMAEPQLDLSALSFFTGFDPNTLREIGASGEPVTAEAGAVLTEQGSVGREAFVVVSGQVQVLVNGQEVAVVGPGSVLGEMALVDLRPRSATLVASTDCELIAFESRRFRDIVDGLSPEARSRLEQRNERFRSANSTIAAEGRPPGRIG